MPGIRAILILITLVLLNSCASTSRRATPEEIVDRALSGQGVAAKVSYDTASSKLSDLPYIPVVTPPDVERVWIFDHVTPSRDLVTGHWVFIILREQKWHIEQDDLQIRKQFSKLPAPPLPDQEK
ncbi:MAG: TraV family lipoprotein [Nitrospirae bacterium]|nr:TraV family lipoprotein [Nitrospirota bacterium]